MIHVLIVDDEPHLVRTLSMNLRRRGYRVSAAQTGSAALERLHAVRPDLILLDLGLPDIDGMDLIGRIRRRCVTVPIIVLSARSGTQDKVAALDRGATDYLCKPFEMDELVARVKASTRDGQASRPAVPGPEG